MLLEVVWLGVLKVVGLVVLGIVVLGVAVTAIGLFYEMGSWREEASRHVMQSDVGEFPAMSGGGFGGVNPCAAVVASDRYEPLDSDVCG